MRNLLNLRLWLLSVLLLALMPMSVTAQQEGIDLAEGERVVENNAGSVRVLARLTSRGNLGSIAFRPRRDEVSPSYTALATASFTEVALWDLRTGQSFAFEGHTDAVMSVAFNPDGTLLVSTSRDGTARVWNLLTFTEQVTFTEHSGAVNSAAISDDGMVVSGGDDGTVRLWNAETGEVSFVMEGHEGAVRSVDISPNGATVVSGGADGTVRFWNAATGELSATVDAHEGEVTVVRFSPGGQNVASAGNDGAVILWNTANRSQIRTFTGHDGAVTGIAFEPVNSSFIATSGADGTVRLWDTGNGAELSVLQGHTVAANSVAFAPGSLALASGGADSEILVWGAAPTSAGVVGVVQSTLNPLLEPGGQETCVAEPEENVLAAGRTFGGELLLYFSGEGCEGSVWLRDVPAGSIAWEDEEQLQNLTTIEIPPPPTPIRNVPEYDELCTEPAQGGSLPAGAPPYTVYDPFAPRDFYPVAATPTEDTGVMLVLCQEFVNVEEEICDYDGLTVSRIRVDEIYRLVNVETGLVAAEQTFTGNTPPECPTDIPLAGELFADPLEPEARRDWLLSTVVGAVEESGTGEGGGRSVINANSVNLRAGPGTNFGVVATGNFGMPVNIIARTPNSDWLAILTPDMQRAWVSASLVNVAASTTVSALPESTATADSLPLWSP